MVGLGTYKPAIISDTPAEKPIRWRVSLLFLQVIKSGYRHSEKSPAAELTSVAGTKTDVVRKPRIQVSWRTPSCFELPRKRQARNIAAEVNSGISKIFSR
jgi:hypothetical protein